MTRALVLLHGFTGSVESWDRVLGALSPGFNARAEPLVGHAPGLVDGPKCSFDEEVDRLAARIRDHHRGPVELVGYSLGARLGLGLCVRHPALLSRAVLIGVNPGLSLASDREQRAAADEVWAQVLEREGLEAFASRWEAQDLFASQRGLPDGVRREQHARRLRHDPQGLARALRSLSLASMPDFRPSLCALSIPVCLVVGESDTRFRALAAEMATLLPRATLRVIPGAGHDVVLEQPRALAAVLMEEP